MFKLSYLKQLAHKGEGSQLCAQAVFIPQEILLVLI